MDLIIARNNAVWPVCCADNFWEESAMTKMMECAFGFSAGGGMIPPRD